MSKGAAAPAAKDASANEEKPAVEQPAADPAKPGAEKPAADTAEKAAEPAKTFTQADLDRALAKREKELRADTEAAAARAKLSEDERKDAEIKDLKSSIRIRDAKDDVMTALEKAGAKGKDLMWKAIKDDLEFDEKTGKVTNLKEVLKDLQADYPDQFGIEKPGETIDGGKGQPAGDKLTKEKLEKMTPTEINALPWDEVRKVLAEK